MRNEATITAVEAIELAGTSISELGVASHKQGYTHLVVSDNMDDALVVVTHDGYYRAYGWTSVYKTGGGGPCNCDACQAGDDPEDWAGDSEHCEGIEDEIQRGIDNCIATS